MSAASFWKVRILSSECALLSHLPVVISNKGIHLDRFLSGIGWYQDRVLERLAPNNSRWCVVRQIAWFRIISTICCFWATFYCWPCTSALFPHEDFVVESSESGWWKCHSFLSPILMLLGIPNVEKQLIPEQVFSSRCGGGDLNARAVSSEIVSHEEEWFREQRE